MGLSSVVFSGAAAFTQLIFPTSCVICGTEYRSGAFCRLPGSLLTVVPLCRGCFDALMEERIVDPCSVCGKPLISEQGRCLSCRSRYTETAPPFAANTALFPYAGKAKALISAYKFGNRKDLAPLLAALLARCALPPPGPDVRLIPVPFRPAGKRKRGWDPVDTVCSILSRRYGYEVSKLLRRRGNSQQKTMNALERRQNIAGSVFIRGAGIPALDEGCRCYLIDDVFTTGATLAACSSLLAGHGFPCLGSCTLVID